MFLLTYVHSLEEVAATTTPSKSVESEVPTSHCAENAYLQYGKRVALPSPIEQSRNSAKSAFPQRWHELHLNETVAASILLKYVVPPPPLQ